MFGMNLREISDFVNAMGLRKWSTGVLFILVMAFLRFKNMVDMDAFVEINQWLILATFGGNVLEHYVLSKYPSSAKPKEPEA